MWSWHLQGQGPLRGTRNRWRVVIIEDDSTTRSLLATFLGSMGCECRGTSSEEALGIIRHEEFDAALLDLRCSGMPVRQLLSAMADTGFDLGKRMLVITDDNRSSPVTKLVHGYPVAGAIPHNGLFLQLWPSLQTIFALPTRQVVGRQAIQSARLIFDSFLQPAPAGVRAFRPSTRQLIYEHGDIRIDLVIEPHAGMGRIAVVGQVLNTAAPKGRTQNLPVALLGPDGPLAETSTNQFGEFEFEFDLPNNADLKIGIGMDTWIFLPLENLDWAKKRLRVAESSD